MNTYECEAKSAGSLQQEGVSVYDTLQYSKSLASRIMALEAELFGLPSAVADNAVDANKSGLFASLNSQASETHEACNSAFNSINHIETALSQLRGR